MLKIVRRTRLRTLFPLVLSLTCVQAQQTQAPADAPKTARLEGTVVSSTGAPIPRAQVRLQGSGTDIAALVNALGTLSALTGTSGTPAPKAAPASATPPAPKNFSATSDAAGKFVIDNIDPGKDYRLTAQKSGFTTGSYGARSPNAPGGILTLSEGQVLKGIALTMTPQGVITGKITDSSGDPVQNVQVSLMRRTYQRGVRTLATSNSATTNDEGEYRIANLSPGRYYLSVSASLSAQLLQLRAAKPDTGPTNIPTYYPASLDVQGAAPLDVAPGSELRGIDVQFRTGKTFSIRGRTTNAVTGGAATGTTVRAVLKSDSGSVLASLQATLSQVVASASQARPNDGSFEIRNLSPGTYVVMNQPATASILNPNAVLPPKLVGSTEVTIADSDVDGIVLPLTSGATITGTAKLEGGDIKNMFAASNDSTDPDALVAAAIAASGVKLPGLEGIGRVNLVLTPIQNATNTARGPLDDNGTFSILNVAPDKYLVNLSVPKGYYAKSITSGGTDLIHSPLDLSAGGGGTMQVVVSDKPGTITGTVHNDKGDAQGNVRITLWTTVPEAGTANDGIRVASADASGKFQFEGLPAGEYRAVAWEDVDQNLVQVREFLSQFEGNSEKLMLAEGATIASDLKMVQVDKSKAAEQKLP